MKILLIKLRHHGDVLLTTPVARALKERFPAAQIDLLVYEGTEAIVKNNPDLCNIWSWNRDLRGWQSIASHLKVFANMKRQRYDWVLHLSDQMQGAFIAKLLAHQSSVGIDYPRRRDIVWRSCFTHLVPLFPSNTHHVVEQNLALLAPLGIDHSLERAFCRLEILDVDRHRIQNYLQQQGVKKPYLVVHPAARWTFKCWEEERFAEVIQHFAQQGWPIIVTSAPDQEEKRLVEAILKKCMLPKLPIFSLSGKLTLGELAALIEGARLFLGVDSVPMHMAAALKKDTVVLFGPSKIQEWHPWKTRYRLIDARDYGVVIDPDAVNTATQERYLKNIPVAPVIAAIEEMLAS